MRPSQGVKRTLIGFRRCGFDSDPQNQKENAVMAKVTPKEKPLRTLEFLMGLRDPRALVAMAPYGLNQQVLERGHDLVRSATLNRLAPFPTQIRVDESLVRRFDRFENVWFPIVKVVLQTNHRAIGEWLFANLSQTSGIDLVVGVGTFKHRFDELAAGTSPFGEEGQKAVGLLRERGFDDVVIADVEDLLARVATFEPQPHVPLDPAEQKAHEDAMWSWYLEWSGIARAVIKDRQVLRGMGFMKRRRAVGSMNDTDEEETDAIEETEVTEATSA